MKQFGGLELILIDSCALLAWPLSKEHFEYRKEQTVAHFGGRVEDEGGRVAGLEGA